MSNKNSGKRGNSQARIDNRRSIVASLLLRNGATAAQVHQALAADSAHWNPDAAQPWAYATVAEDVRELRQSWRDSASVDISEHHSRIFNELQEIKHAAWERNRLSVVLNALESEMRLLGIDNGAPPLEAGARFQYGSRQEFEDAALARFHALAKDRRPN